MQSNLEKLAINERQEELVRSEYNVADQYSLTHKNTKGDNDTKGKGTNHGGHTDFLPNLDKKGSTSTIEYSNFDTKNGGNSIDSETRQKSITKSLYNKDNPYMGEKGKGGINSGHGHFKPITDKNNISLNTINYSNFDTDKGGSNVDSSERAKLMTYSLYNKDKFYGPHLLDTELNQRDGQYRN